MGRKIPGRKHKGVRDPEKQQALRLESLKDKINAPPVNPDNQYIPKSLTRVMELKEKTKNGMFNSKRRRKKSDALPEKVVKRVSAKPDNPTPKFEQRRGESDKRFIHRVSLVCQSVIKEAAFEKKYGVEIKRNPETFKVESVAKRKKDEIDELMRKARKPKNDKKEKKKKTPVEPRLTKSQKKLQKLKQKKQLKVMRNVDEFAKYQDSVKFGEIVHAPPSLVVPKKAVSTGVARPGTKDLQLKHLLNVQNININKSKSTRVVASTGKLRKVADKVINRKGKRKDLPMGVRRQLDQQQQEIITAYKQLKDKKLDT